MKIKSKWKYYYFFMSHYYSILSLSKYVINLHLGVSVLEDSDIANVTEVKKLKKRIKRNQVMQSNEESM